MGKSSFIYLNVPSHKPEEGLPSSLKFDYIITYNLRVSFNKGTQVSIKEKK
jgi:hypothetical protein